MKKIDGFVNSIYAHASSKEAKELKQEMRSHLLEAVEELIREGKTEKEAVTIAIERFGDEKQIKRGVFSLFNPQTNMIKNLFRTSLVTLFLCLIVLIGLIWTEHNNQNRLLNIDYVVDNASRIMTGGSFSEKKINQINSLFDVAKEFEYVALYINPDPEPREGASKKEMMKNWKVAIESGDPSIKDSSQYVLIDIKDPYENYYLVAGHHQIPTLNNSYYSIPIGLFIAFAVLGLTSFFLKINTNRKVLNAFIK
jgi:hypothetical protein